MCFIIWKEQTRTPASVQESSSVRHDDLQRIKEEPVRPPESPLPDAAGRSIGESYAAAWTAKHSEMAVKAEPPADWLNNDGNNWQDYLYLVLLLFSNSS